MSPYHHHEKITNEQIKEWYNKASLNKFNVFDDYNKIILQLCRKLLEGSDDEK